MYICLCRGITESTVRELAREGVVCAATLACELGIDEPDCCGRCLKNIDSLVGLTQEQHRSELSSPLVELKTKF